MKGRSARILGLAGGLLISIIAIATATASTPYSFGGHSRPFLAVELAAGWSLVAAGVLAHPERHGRQFGLALLTAGSAWFLVEFDNPGASAVVFTIGLLLHAVCPPLVAHALAGYPARTPSRSERVVLAWGYAIAFVPMGLLPAVAFVPARQGCTVCPDNLLALRSAPDVVWWSLNIGSSLLIGWALTVLVLLGGRIRAATVAARRRLLPVLLPGVVYLGLVGAWFWHGLGPGFPGPDVVGRALWLGQASALLGVAGGVAFDRWQAWRVRTAVAQLVVDAARARPGGLREAFADMLNEPSLNLLFPLADGRTVDAHGRPAAPEPGQVVTGLRHDGSVVAVLAHRRGLLDEPDAVQELTTLARLALYTERLQAETQVKLDDLRASRARIVAIGDAERRRLERDLHDGVQQRLVTLALSIRLARLRASPVDERMLAAAETQVQATLSDLREVAHGLCPAVLDSDGLAAGLEALAERSPVRLTVTGLPARRLDRSVEQAAYVLVAETLKRTACTEATVQAADDGARTTIAINTNGTDLAATTDLEDRVGAVHGSLTVQGATVRAEFPCAS
ncbi:MAG TPA: histidine kinase [Actinophytocola sp.]|uniref:sensor histidine kinase n=1 Tax=Actinophytocola sp. TaxID=1872138 RepID=UPI002F9542FD